MLAHGIEPVAELGVVGVKIEPPRQVLDPRHPLLVGDLSVAGFRTVMHAEGYGDHAFHRPAEETVAA
jgi:hypothetical protein